MAEFPARDAIRALVNDELVSRWERLITIRDRVNVALEAKRQDKTIGTSLAAHVTLRASGETLTLLERYRDDLPMLFIVSAVSLEPAGSDDVEVDVRRADGHKCARCWRIVPVVSTAPATDGLCDRCVGAVTAAA